MALRGGAFASLHAARVVPLRNGTPLCGAASRQVWRLHKRPLGHVIRPSRHRASAAADAIGDAGTPIATSKTAASDGNRAADPASTLSPSDAESHPNNSPKKDDENHDDDKDAQMRLHRTAQLEHEPEQQEQQQQQRNDHHHADDRSKTDSRTNSTAVGTAAATGAARLALSLAAIGGAERLAHALLPAGGPLPAPLAAMLALLAVCLGARAARAGRAVDALTRAVFAPGCAFLGRWLAVFFAPNLVLLPLAPSLPSSDIAAIAATVLAGLAMSTLATLATSVLLRRAFPPPPPSLPPPQRSVDRELEGQPQKTSQKTQAAPHTPSDGLVRALAAGVAVSFVAGVLCVRLAAANIVLRQQVSLLVPVVTLARALAPWPIRIYGTLLTMLTFVIGQRFSKRVRLFLHPLLTCTVGTVAGVWLLATCTGTSLIPALDTYYFARGSGSIWGGGNVLAALLGPAVVSFAFQMDARRQLLAARFVEIVGTSMVGSIVGLFGTALLARVLGASPAIRLVLIPRQITAALAIPIAEILGAHVGLAASIVAITGLIGASCIKLILSVLRVSDPVARGLIAGTAAHGLGTAAMADETSAFPFAALAMVLVGIFSTLLVALPPVRSLLLRVALGGLANSKLGVPAVL